MKKNLTLLLISTFCIVTVPIICNNSMNNLDRIGLLQAIISDNKPRVGALITAGANVNLAFSSHLTPLMVAVVVSGNFSMVQYLVENHNANVNLIDPVFKHTALDMALNALITLKKIAWEESCKTKKDYSTILALAIYPYLAIINYLVSKGAITNSERYKGKTIEECIEMNIEYC